MDHNRLENLALQLKRFEAIIESNTVPMTRDVGNLIAATKRNYPEHYVRSTVASIENTLSSIQRDQKKLLELINRKESALRWAAAEYRRAEVKSKIRRLQKPIVSSSYKFLGTISKALLDSWRFKETAKNKIINIGKNAVSCGINGIKSQGAKVIKIKDRITCSTLQLIGTISKATLYSWKLTQNATNKAFDVSKNAVTGAVRGITADHPFIEKDFFAAEISHGGEAVFAPKDGEVGIGYSAEVGGYVAKGEVAGHIGPLSGSASVTAVSAKAVGEAKAYLYDDGEFKPSLKLKAEAEAKGLTGEVAGQLGNDRYNIHAGAEGTVGVAAAEAVAVIDKDGLRFKADAGLLRWQVKSLQV